MMAHLDTVFPVGSAAQHPFRIDGDWAWGLGVGDCKSGVLISLFGALILKKAGLLPPWELTYLFNCDEEIGSGSGRKLFAREAERLQVAYTNCFAHLETPAEDVTIPVETFGDAVDMVEYKFIYKENVARCVKMGVPNLPSMYINGELKYRSIIPAKAELEQAIREAIEACKK